MCPNLPFQQLGLGASYVYAKTVPSYATPGNFKNFIGSTNNVFSDGDGTDGANPFIPAVPIGTVGQGNADSIINIPYILRAQPNVSLS